MRVPSSPHPLFGLRSARGLWKLVGAVWTLGLVATLPAAMVMDSEVGGPLREMTDCSAAAGDALLIALPAAVGAARPLFLALLGGALMLWAGTLLWHAGIVSWYGTGGAGPFRLAELVARGALRFWVYARLSAVALLALLAGLVVVVTPLGWGAGRARDAMAEGTTMALVGLGGLVGLLWSVVAWSATLRGAWRVGFDPRRSVLRAWFGGLADTCRRPLTTLGTVVLWGTLGSVLVVAPLALGMLLPQLRGGAAGAVVAAVAGLARAAVWVALFLSFADGEPPRRLKGE